MPASSTRRSRAELLRRVREAPVRPGVYFFRDVEGTILYIGKSVCLKDRVRSYFTGRPPTRKLRRLRREIAAVEWQETGSELEALLLESRLVKRHLPRYNTLLRDFRPATYLRIDWRDPFPRIEVTRQPRADGAEYFGPFGARDALEKAVGTVADTLQLRTCDPAGASLAGTRPCYRSEFGFCSAPCAGRITVTAYRQRVVEAGDLFAGRGEAPLRILEEKMETAAERLRFETAAQLRDAIRFIRAAAGRQQALQSAIRRLNLLAACPSARVETVALFLFASGRLILQQEVPRAGLADAAARRRLAREIAAARAGYSAPPVEDLTAEHLDEIQIVSAWMRRRTGEGTHLDLPPGLGRRETAREVAAWLAGAATLPRSDAPAPRGS